MEVTGAIFLSVTGSGKRGGVAVEFRQQAEFINSVSDSGDVGA